MFSAVLASISITIFLFSAMISACLITFWALFDQLIDPLVQFYRGTYHKTRPKLIAKQSAPWIIFMGTIFQFSTHRSVHLGPDRADNSSRAYLYLWTSRNCLKKQQEEISEHPFTRFSANIKMTKEKKFEDCIQYLATSEPHILHTVAGLM